MKVSRVLPRWSLTTILGYFDAEVDSCVLEEVSRFRDGARLPNVPVLATGPSLSAANSGSSFCESDGGYPAAVVIVLRLFEGDAEKKNKRKVRKDTVQCPEAY